jgi:O-antigen/teichoic acid export membrane protein
VFVGADQIGVWFGDPELARIMRWMAILPAISAFAAAPTAATKRDMLFQPLAMRSIGSLFVGGVVGLILTLTGAGVWALVWQAIVTRLTSSIVLWYAVPLKFSLRFSRRHLSELVHFAAPTMVSKLLSWTSNQIPRVLLGLFWGSTDLGLFSLAARLGDLLMEIAVVPRYAVARVELRRFAHDHPGLKAALGRILTMLTVFCFPLCVGGAAIVPTLFHVWLDPRWVGAIVPAQLLLLTCIPLCTQYVSGAALLALNFQRAEALVSMVQTVATVVAVAVCAPFGLVWASIGIAARPFCSCRSGPRWRQASPWVPACGCCASPSSLWSRTRWRCRSWSAPARARISCWCGSRCPPWSSTSCNACPDVAKAKRPTIDPPGTPN